MNSLPRIFTCDDGEAPDAPPWLDFLGFDEAIKALRDGCVLDAVEARVRAVENAGVKSVGITGRPDRDGRVTLDAGIMSGWNELLAAVGALEGYQNPSWVVRRMLDMQAAGNFKAAFLTGRGAALFAHEQGAKPAALRATGTQKTPAGQAHDTVGCIAFDGTNWAVATSTSGGEGKFPDRVGDVPLPCNGFIATKACAAFCTWTGDTAMRLAMPKHVDVLVKQGVPINKAVHAALAGFNDLKQGNLGGVILYAAAADGCAVAGIGFEGAVAADYTLWQEGMEQPIRRPVPKWHPTESIPVLSS